MNRATVQRSAAHHGLQQVMADAIIITYHGWRKRIHWGCLHRTHMNASMQMILREVNHSTYHAHGDRPTFNPYLLNMKRLSWWSTGQFDQMVSLSGKQLFHCPCINIFKKTIGDCPYMILRVKKLHIIVLVGAFKNHSISTYQIVCNKC